MDPASTPSVNEESSLLPLRLRRHPSDSSKTFPTTSAEDQRSRAVAVSTQSAPETELELPSEAARSHSDRDYGCLGCDLATLCFCVLLLSAFLIMGVTCALLVNETKNCQENGDCPQPLPWAGPSSGPAGPYPTLAPLPMVSDWPRWTQAMALGTFDLPSWRRRQMSSAGSLARPTDDVHSGDALLSRNGHQAQSILSLPQSGGRREFVSRASTTFLGRRSTFE
jgi:hypothetical protein